MCLLFFFGATCGLWRYGKCTYRMGELAFNDSSATRFQKKRGRTASEAKSKKRQTKKKHSRCSALEQQIQPVLRKTHKSHQKINSSDSSKLFSTTKTNRVPSKYFVKCTAREKRRTETQKKGFQLRRRETVKQSKKKNLQINERHRRHGTLGGQ